MQEIAAAIFRATGIPFADAAARPLAGGCINQAHQLSDGKRTFFVKTNSADLLPMFEAESAGLTDILATRTVRAPQPVCSGATGGQAYLVLEYLDLHDHGDDSALAQQLAALHRHSAAQFGWRRENTIGSTPQINIPDTDWVAFLRQHRLGYQLELAARNNLDKQLITQGQRLLEYLADFFTGYAPQASLLHGDLWGGNAAFMQNGQPVVFDPAVYYGDREAELAMTELFGGFSSRFYAAYQAAWPLDAGYTTRKTLYKLYHILNHANLFGGAYPGQAKHMIQRLLASRN